ncbi:MAG: 50S ribosomal protein L24 [Candidatus Omnitrophica bacterium]|nr:50S ribosomal protein L24 [Candidatus Omnitrophota bacterium]
MRIRKNDQVMVISGKDRGKKGRVMKIFPKEGMLLVEKVNYMKKATRRTKDNPKGGIAQMEEKLAISNVMFICPKCSHPTRISYNFLADGTKQRVCHKCHEIL